MDFLKQGKNLLALQFFKQVKDSLEKNQLTNSKPWIDVTRRYRCLSAQDYPH